MNPQISIIIPVYNQESCLKKCLDSLNQQSLKKFEAICVDDGSTDRSAEILKKCAEEDPRIKIVSQSNTGTGVARKRGVAASTGEYLMFLDPDDELLPGALETVYSAIKRIGTDMLQFGVKIDTSRDVSAKEIADLKFFLRQIPGKLVGSDAILSTIFLSEKKFSHILCNRIYRGSICREAFSEVAESRILTAEDGYAFLLLAYFAQSAASIPDKCYLYHYGNGISGKKDRFAKFQGKCEDIVSIKAAFTAFIHKQNDTTAIFRRAVDAFYQYLLNDAWVQITSLIHNGQQQRMAADLLLKTIQPEDAIPAAQRMTWIQPEFWTDLFYRLPALEYQPRKIRTVGLVGNRLYNGGVERVIALLIPILQSIGLKVVLFTSEAANKDDYPIPGGVTRIVLPANDIEKRIKKLHQAIAEQKIDLIWHHIYYEPKLLWDLLAVKTMKIPFILTYHNSFSALISTGNKNFLPLLKMVQLTDMELALSHTDVCFFRHYGGIAEYFPNPLTFPVQDAPPREVHKGTPPVILFPARISLEKQPQEAVRIFAEVLKEIPDAKLVIAGTGKEQFLQPLKECIAHLHLEKQVCMRGYCQNMQEEFARADLMLMTSLFEGFPMALLEAKSVGMPIVAYDLPYLETMKPNTGVATVPSLDRQAAAAEIVSLLQNPARYAAYSVEARANAQFFANYDLKNEYAKLFRSFEQPPVHDGESDPETKLMLETLLQSIQGQRRQSYKEGRLDRQEEITSGLTWRTGHALLALPLRLREKITGKE